MEGLTQKWMKLMQLGHYCGCHQIPERSFFIGGYQFPLCARCTGLLIGELLTYVLFPLKIIISPVLSVFFLLVMGIDWLMQFIEVMSSTNFRRLITGILGGVGITSLFLHLVMIIINFSRQKD